MLKRRVAAFALLVSLLSLTDAGTGAPPARGPDDDPKVAPFTTAFTGTNDQAAKQAVATLTEQLRTNKNRGWILTHLRRRWIQDLVDAKRFDLADDLCIDGILGDPTQTRELEYFQGWRVEILLAQDKPEDALAQAKLLYNVSSMYGHEAAVKTLYRCLQATHADKALLRQFRNEQVTGSMSTTLEAPAVTSPTLLKIVGNGSDYALDLASLDNSTERRAVASGNLFLLTDQPDKAMKSFEQALRLHRGKSADELYENIARAMKASEGTVGHANAYDIEMSREIAPEHAADRPLGPNGVPIP
jgi:hypothetical protein